MTWISDAAHNSNVDNPEVVNRCMEEYLISITIGDYKVKSRCDHIKSLSYGIKN